MKKVLISFIVLLVGGTAILPTIWASPALSFVCATDNYCPKGYVCEATNCSAVYGNNTITGIAIYKNDKGDVLAYVPGHGHLRCTYMENVTPNGKNNSWSWYINVNNNWYEIIGYRG